MLKEQKTDTSVNQKFIMKEKVFCKLCGDLNNNDEAHRFAQITPLNEQSVD